MPGAASVQPLTRYGSIMVAGHVDCGLCEGLGEWEGERERGKIQGKKLLFSLLMHVQRKKTKHNVVPNDTILCFFLIEQYKKQCCFEQNAPFHLK